MLTDIELYEPKLENKHALNFEGVVNEFYSQEQNVEEQGEQEYLPFDPANELPQRTEQLECEDELWYVENAELFATDADALTENLPNITRLSDKGFIETAARLYLLATGAERALGTILWTRLRETLGFEQAKDSPARNTQIWKWAAQIDSTDSSLYHRLNRWITDAMARALEPRVEQMSPTAGHEIGIGIDSNDEDVVRDTIAKRADAVKEIDPTMESTTDSVRNVKALEKNGNHSPSLVRERDLSDESIKADYVYRARLKVGETHDEETGEITDVYDYFPVARFVLEQPPSEELRPQVKTYQDNMLRRIGGKDSLNGKFVGGSHEQANQD